MIFGAPGGDDELAEAGVQRQQREVPAHRRQRAGLRVFEGPEAQEVQKNHHSVNKTLLDTI